MNPAESVSFIVNSYNFYWNYIQDISLYDIYTICILSYHIILILIKFINNY